MRRLISSDQETSKVLCNQPASWRTTKASRKALGAVFCLKLDAEGPENVDTPLCTRCPVCLVSRHGSRDLGVDQPVSSFDIVVVTTRANSLDDVCLDLLDLGERPDAALSRHVGGCQGEYSSVSSGSCYQRG